jgi:hypothetical protein
MKFVIAPKRRRKNFDFLAKRRREIVLHACYVGAADTEDLSRWLIAWSWHNSQSKDPIQSLIWAAERMGRKNFTAADAEAILEEASRTRRHMSADNLGRFLGLTYVVRKELRITTIGARDVPKRARRELRKRNDRLYQERKRCARGARPHSQSLSRTKPWEAMNMSRRTWERHRNKTRDANSSAAIFLSNDDKLASRERKHGHPSGAVAPKKARGLPSSQTATTLAADVYATLPLELRMAGLCLPMPENLARAA